MIQAVIEHDRKERGDTLTDHRSRGGTRNTHRLKGEYVTDAGKGYLSEYEDRVENDVDYRAEPLHKHGEHGPARSLKKLLYEKLSEQPEGKDADDPHIVPAVRDDRFNISLASHKCLGEEKSDRKEYEIQNNIDIRALHRRIVYPF